MTKKARWPELRAKFDNLNFYEKFIWGYFQLTENSKRLFWVDHVFFCTEIRVTQNSPKIRPFSIFNNNNFLIRPILRNCKQKEFSFDNTRSARPV